MAHHVFHVHKDDRLPVLLDLAAAPGRTVMFTRTKHGAKKLAKQLNASGVPAVELHGNLSQGARTRNMDAFHGGAATTLVATDIAARGIHVDDVGLVVHADPPVEHKAYLHRSGRTARAGASGTVITLMTADQVADVRDLTRKAGIKPTTTRLDATHPLLRELAPGERAFSGGLALAQASDDQQRRGPARGGQAGRGGQGGRGGSDGQTGRGSSGRGRNGGAGGGRNASSAPGGAKGSGGAAAGRKTSGSGRRTGSPKGGSAAVYSTSTGSGSGGAAAFSSRSRAGSRGGR
jgi:superfamily II DNA/RNA helicase